MLDPRDHPQTADRETEPVRTGTALCLSGGGYRASLFHLGALRRLNELGILAKVDTICSVSGGSIIAAHLIDVIVRYYADANCIPPDEWETKVAVPFRRFAARDIRSAPIFKRFLLPWNWFRRSTQVRALETRYRRHLTQLRLIDLPEKPNLILCSTDITFGANFIISRNGTGDYQAGYYVTLPEWPLARAVAVSSCFPPIFNPLPIRPRPSELSGGQYPPGKERDRLVSGLSLSDGGVYDNLGLEPAWKDHRSVLVSDGGAPFVRKISRAPWSLMMRYIGIATNQSLAVRKRWLIDKYVQNDLDGTYWGIASATERYGEKSPRGYSKRLAAEVISKVRTDLDGFLPSEMAVLENHGYLLAEAAVRRHAPDLQGDNEAELKIPHPEWMDEAKVRTALAESHRRLSLNRLLGRLD